MDYQVYVISENNEPLMPTKRFGNVRRMLKEKRAKVVQTKPFTIKLLFETTNYTEDLVLGIDTGRTNISITVSNKNTGEALYSSELETRNKEVPKLMSDRKSFRGQRRRNRRLAKVRLAKYNDTTYKNAKNIVHIGAKNSLPMKYIKGKPARFIHRTRHKGWLTPTANHLLETHLNYVSLVSSLLPIKKYVVEYGVFDTQKLDNATIGGTEYQNGTLSGFKNLEDFISFTQGGQCLMCNKNIEHYHHIVPKVDGGANTHHNIAGLCKGHHDRVHKNKKEEEKLQKLKEGTKKRYDSSSILNTVMPSLFTELQETHGKDSVFKVFGYETREIREKLNLPKTHYYDSYVLSLKFTDLTKTKTPTSLNPYRLKQFRRHNRQKLYATRDRTYKLDGKTVAKNKNKRTGQKDNSLKEFREEIAKINSKKEVRRILSNLKVTPSKRYYRKKLPFQPGSIVSYNCSRYVVKGSLTNGAYLRLYNYPLKNGKEQNIPAREVSLITRKRGLVYL